MHVRTPVITHLHLRHTRKDFTFRAVKMRGQQCKLAVGNRGARRGEGARICPLCLGQGLPVQHPLELY